MRFPKEDICNWSAHCAGRFFLLFLVFLTFSLHVLTSTLFSSSLYLCWIAKDEMLFHISPLKCLKDSSLVVVVSDGENMKPQWEFQ